MRGCSDVYQAGDLPEYVLGLRSPNQVNVNGVTFFEISRYLEDPHIVFTTGKGDICGYFHTCAPLVEARVECQPANIPSSQFDEIGVLSSGGIRIRGFHVQNSRG